MFHNVSKQTVHSLDYEFAMDHASVKATRGSFLQGLFRACYNSFASLVASVGTTNLVALLRYSGNTKSVEQQVSVACSIQRLQCQRGEWFHGVEDGRAVRKQLLIDWIVNSEVLQYVS